MAESKKAEAKKTSTKDIIAKKAEQSKKNVANGGKPVEISLTDTVNVRFTKNFGFMKEGQEQRISALAYETYNANGVVEKIN